MANNFGGGYFTVMDYDREVATVSFNTAAITAVSLPGTLTQFGALRTALQGIIAGVLVGEGLYVNRTKLANTPPTDEDAQRERKWLVTYEDTTEFFDPPTNAIPNAGYRQLFSAEIPAADPVGRLLENTDIADLDNEDIDDFVTAWEALVKSPYGGAVNVVRITLVGRNT